MLLNTKKRFIFVISAFAFFARSFGHDTNINNINTPTSRTLNWTHTDESNLAT